MYPIFLRPALKDYLWGGRRLPEQYGYATDLEKVAEAWILSCHPEGASIVSNGPDAGRTLPAVLADWGDAALGERGKAFGDFPILIKFIDARDRLSLQVHPDDDYAARIEHGFGKTEMWYVLDCEPGAQLIYGVNRPLTRDAFRQHIEDNTVEQDCRFVPVKKGDVFYIPSGTLHAIGAGILIAEVQQNSATTYRVSDYGRLGADGKPRALHIDKAVDVTSLTPTEPPDFGADTVRRDENGVYTRLASCRYFTAERWAVDGTVPIAFDDTFASLVCLEGIGSLDWDGQSRPVAKGDSIFLPAGVAAALSGSLEMLISYI